MSKLLGLLLASALAAGGALAQTASQGSSASSDGDSSSASSVTGQGATTEGALGASGGAIIRPGSPGYTNGSTSTGTNAMGASGAPGTTGLPGAGESTRKPTRHSGATKARRGDCPPGLEKKDNGCLPAGQGKKLDSR